MTPPPVRIAVVLPLTGAESLFGQQGLQGAQLAAAEINAGGGVLGGRPISLEVHDEGTDLDRAVAFTRAAVDSDVTAVLGPTSSTHRDAMLPICAAARIPLLYATDYEGGACSRYLFCYSAIPDHYLPSLVETLTAGSDDFAMVGADYSWPRTIGARLRRDLNARGCRLLHEEYVPVGAGDMADVVTRAVDCGAGAVVMALMGSDGQDFIRRFAALDRRPQLAVIAFNENYMTGLAPSMTEGIITALPFLESLQAPEARDFVSRQRAMFGAHAVVSYFAESHYGLLMFLRHALESAGSDDSESVIDAMGDVTLTIGHGPVTLRAADHHMVLNMLVAQAQSGRLVATRDVGPVSPPNQCGVRTLLRGEDVQPRHVSG
ncbi:MAG: Aliphatic amidase expression-regulating protein [Actinomycetota bacterium]|nr:Aliphatic amidase expression-regulating protein [Actinomycetota bacterium]